MRRLLLVALAVVVGLAVVSAAVVFILLRPGSEATSPATEQGSSSAGLTPAEESELSAADLSAADSDSDGLINSEEARWNSDPDKADTDGDGYLDGEEVRAGHDPTKPAPNDKLPGQSLSGSPPPAAAAAAPGTAPAVPAPLDPEQYLADDLDLAGGSANLTEEFERQYAAAERSSATMSEYAKTQLTIELLPRPVSQDLPSQVYPDAAETISSYLGVADNPTALANQSMLIVAMSDLAQYSDPSTMLGFADLERTYREQLTAAIVPASALPVHKLLLGYSEALVATFDQIALYTVDPVKSRVATLQLMRLDRKYYPLIHAEFARLRVLQDSLASPGG